MFWAGFMWNTRTELVIMEGDLDAPRNGVTARIYLEILKEHLPTILGHDSIFMQDNAPIHTARIIQEWLEEEGIEVMGWPPYSPDLNPIENLWKRLKDEIMKRHPELATMGNGEEAMAHLIRCAKEAWEFLKDELLNKLALGMQKRVTAIKEANGWYTKY